MAMEKSGNIARGPPEYDCAAPLKRPKDWLTPCTVSLQGSGNVSRTSAPEYDSGLPLGNDRTFLSLDECDSLARQIAEVDLITPYWMTMEKSGNIARGPPEYDCAAPLKSPKDRITPCTVSLQGSGNVSRTSAPEHDSALPLTNYGTNGATLPTVDECDAPCSRTVKVDWITRYSSTLEGPNFIYTQYEYHLRSPVKVIEPCSVLIKKVRNSCTADCTSSCKEHKSNVTCTVSYQEEITFYPRYTPSLQQFKTPAANNRTLSDSKLRFWKSSPPSSIDKTDVLNQSEPNLPDTDAYTGGECPNYNSNTTAQCVDIMSTAKLYSYTDVEKYHEKAGSRIKQEQETTLGKPSEQFYCHLQRWHRTGKGKGLHILISPSSSSSSEEGDRQITETINQQNSYDSNKPNRDDNQHGTELCLTPPTPPTSFADIDLQSQINVMLEECSAYIDQQIRRKKS